MNTKTKILILLFFTISTIGFCQNYKREIEGQFLDYNKLIIKKDFSKSMAYITEEFFEIIPKEQMILVMEKAFSNPEMEFELMSPKVDEISEVEKIGDKLYVLLSYSSPMKMKFINSEEKDKGEDELRINMLKMSLKQMFGSENVKYNEETEFFNIVAKKQAYAISTNGKSDWKFLVIEKKQKFILDKLLPAQLVEKI